MRSIAANALFVMIVLGLVAVGAVTWGVNQVSAPGPLTEPARFVVPRGASLNTVADLLAEEGVIASPALFRIAARYRDQDASLRFGEYEVAAGASVEQVLDLLSRGANVNYAVTAPEGLTSAEIVAILNAEPLLTGEIDETPAEGALAPDTYAIQRGDDRAAVLARMTALQARRVADAWAGRAEGLLLESPLELLTLASIIEKETAVPDEMPRVSAVFHNRLRRGMRLQSDPTIIYGITEGAGPLGRALTRRDIDTPTPWNTYTINGLPPTPIANPGAAALQAAANPAEDDALYFVADGTGGHAFARTLSEHNRNVARWRQIERQRRDGN
jgi:UPF0755 protein